MTEKQYRLNKWGTRLLKNNRPLFDWTNESDKIVDLLNSLNEENKELKEEIAKFKEWEKHIGDVKREDLDMVFKMSIYEIAEAFEYYRKRIKELEQ